MRERGIIDKQQMYRVLLPVDKQGKILVGESGMFGFYLWSITD